jgi:hypothetical protein
MLQLSPTVPSKGSNGNALHINAAMLQIIFTNVVHCLAQCETDAPYVKFEEKLFVKWSGHLDPSVRFYVFIKLNSNSHRYYFLG